MTDTFKSWRKSFFIYFFVHFCGNPGSKVARGVRVNQPCRDSNHRPSGLQPDAMTIRQRRPDTGCFELEAAYLNFQLFVTKNLKQQLT